MNKYNLPKYRKGQAIKILANGSVSRVIRISYEGGHNWYEVKDQDGTNKHFAENELGKI